MTTHSSVRRSNFRRTELNEVVSKERSDGSDRVSGQQQASGSIVQNKDDRAVFDEVFLPHMAEAYRLAQWHTGNANDAEDVVQDAALRAFRGIGKFGAVNPPACPLTILPTTPHTCFINIKQNTLTF